jgi:CobQ-like glutamine amidotransferase family enzyme
MKLKLIHFFADKLNLYGDRGNVKTLVNRCAWRGIELEVIEQKNIEGLDLAEADILFIGGGSDREQALCTEDLRAIKDDLKEKIEDGIVMLTICGGYQFLGTHYIAADGSRLEGLGILDLHTETKGERLIGNLVISTSLCGDLTGFENHGGRTYHNYETLGTVRLGGGNNGEDGKEGLVYKNLIGTYMHGPLLPKNPQLADELIKRALTRKYGTIEPLVTLDDRLEKKACEQVWTLYGSQGRR